MPRRWQLVRARADAVPSSVRRFAARARRRRFNTARPWLIVGGVVFLAGVVGWVVFASPLLTVSGVEVRGTHILTPEEVQIAAEVPGDIPLARVDVDAVQRRVAVLAPVESVEVSRSWPGTVLVEVKERQPVAVVPQGVSFGLLDDSGVLFHMVLKRPPNLPVVKVANPGPEDPTTRAGLQVLASLTPELRTQLVALVAESVTRIRLELDKGRSVVWGDAEASERKSRTATLLLGRPGKVIDVSAPDFPVMR